MIKDILNRAGFVEGKTYKETRFIKPPKETYVVYMDSFSARGADSRNLVKDHDYTIELYSDVPDQEAEARIESNLDFFQIEYEKSERYWLQSEQMFQVVYNFNIIQK